MICMDVWGGEQSMDHIARYMLSVDDALMAAKVELDQGYLVNLRKEVAWGSEEMWDTRIKEIN